VVVLAVRRRRHPLSRWIGRSLIAVGLTVALWLLPGSRGQWTAAVGLVVYLVLWELGPLKLRPFHIHIEPKWSAILADHQMLPDETDERRLKRRRRYSPLKHGISFTILDERGISPIVMTITSFLQRWT
jgi:hypothetical protein